MRRGHSIGHRSNKARKIAEERAGQRFSLLAMRGSACQACPLTPVGTNPPRQWTDVHEILTRARGGDPTDTENQLCVCRRCHDWIGTHETAARELGLIRGRTAAEHVATFRPWQPTEHN